MMLGKVGDQKTKDPRSQHPAGLPKWEEKHLLLVFYIVFCFSFIFLLGLDIEVTYYCY